MADNPLPAKWNEIQMVIDSETKKLRTRSPEDCTVSGAGVAHNKYIVAAPVAVCAQRMLMCRICPRHVLTASRCAWKVSMRGTAKPGRAGANLSVSDFKHSRRLYALCSREAPGVIWLEPLPSRDAAVVAFATRRKDECPDQKYLDHGDTFDAFCSEFNSMEQRALLFMRKQCPRTPHPGTDTWTEWCAESEDFNNFLKTGEQNLEGFMDDEDDLDGGDLER